MIDCRLPENRLEAFRRIAYVRMIEGDCDHHHTSKVIAKEMNLSNDDRALYSLLFGHSYRNHWAMIIFQLFPDLLKRDINEIQEWHDKNWHRSMYSGDTKWNVRLFPKFVKAVQDYVQGGSLYQRLGDLVTSDNVETNFKNLNGQIRKIHSMGRMCAWLADQALYEFFDWKIDYWNMQLLEGSTWSQYDALCYFFDRMDIIRKNKFILDEKGKMKLYNPTKEDKLQMESCCQKLLTYCNDNLPFHLDVFNIESILCETRKTFYGPRIKEYTFWTSNELVEQYPRLKKLWEDYPTPINWKPYVTAFMCKGSIVSNYGYSPEYFKVVSEHGINLNMHHYFNEKNAYEELNLPKPETVNSFAKPMLDDWNQFSVETQLSKIKYYDPKKYLKWKNK